MNSNLNNEVINEDIAIMVDKLNKRRESGRTRAQKFYDLHKDDLKQQKINKEIGKARDENKDGQRKKRTIEKRAQNTSNNCIRYYQRIN